VRRFKPSNLSQALETVAVAKADKNHVLMSALLQYTKAGWSIEFFHSQPGREGRGGERGRGKEGRGRGRARGEMGRWEVGRGVIT
jgi:hypothetical protein